jgi:site-specific recombinase XerD
MSAKRVNGSTRENRQIRYLTQEQVRALFQAAKKRPVRDQLLIAFLYRYGLRASEVCGLATRDVERHRGEVRVVGAKGGLERLYTLPRDLRPLLRRHEPGEEFFFASRQGTGRLARTRVWQIVKETMAAAGIPVEFNVHSLRHSAAVHALDAGLQLEDVRDLLRHRRMASTEVYGTISVRRRNDYLKRLDASPEIVKVR